MVGICLQWKKEASLLVEFTELEGEVGRGVVSAVGGVGLVVEGVASASEVVGTVGGRGVSAGCLAGTGPDDSVPLPLPSDSCTGA